MPDSLFSRLTDALRECADDLEAEIDHRYGNALHYESERRRYARDMAPVVRARALLAEWEEWKLRWREGP